MGQMRGPFRFRELSRVEISGNVWLVISLRSDGRIAVATGNLTVVEGRSKMMFNPDPLLLKDARALGDVGNCMLDAFEKLEPTVDTTPVDTDTQVQSSK